LILNIPVHEFNVKVDEREKRNTLYKETMTLFMIFKYKRIDAFTYVLCILLGANISLFDIRYKY